MLAMLAIVVMALFGVFGRTMGEGSAENAGIGVRIEYPQRIRYKEAVSMQITLTNGTGQFIDTLTVALNETYLRQFNEVSFTPDVERITDHTYVVELADVQPGEIRSISVEFHAERYGQVDGNVTVSSNTVDPFVVAFDTIIFP